MVYRIFYFEYDDEGNKILRHDIIDNIKNIEGKYLYIYYLTDINGDVIIDNRKRGKKK